jgi:formylglycine-generating enzyme required for sulfatase activity
MLWTGHELVSCMGSRFVKVLLTVVGAIFFTTLGIFAADRLQGIDSSLSNIANVGGGVCQKGMAPLRVNGGTLCVDIYEASPSSECLHKSLSSLVQSEQNANTRGCSVISVEDALPWTYISLPQAQRMCASAGKRLPTADEWYHIALGTDPESCVVDEASVSRTGTHACISSIGSHDVIGNVWEWVDEQVVGNEFNGRPLPEDGYVTSVDAGGIAITSDDAPDEMYGADYFWSEVEGVFGMIRGGSYTSQTDAGLYTVNAAIETSFASRGIGFRCVEDVF